jgi:hypothetical protein
MTRDETTRMAQVCDLGRVCGPLDTLLDHEWEDLQRFAGLVAAEERERNLAAASEACRHHRSFILSTRPTALE